MEEMRPVPISAEIAKFPILNAYCEDLTAKTYVSNPAIAREDEIKKTMLVLLTPEKSALLIGKAGIGKTAIVEGIAYRIQKGEVPNALKGYRILKVNTSSMLGKVKINGLEKTVTDALVAELKVADKVILFIDEVHTLMGASGEHGPMDLANILKPALDRGDVKAIGATTIMEYETYIIRDRAFLRRFDRIDVAEPSEETTVEILMGTLPKMEHKTGIKMKYGEYLTRMLMTSIVSATSEYKRVYGISAMYPDVSLSVLSAAFSNALFDNKQTVDVSDVYKAICNSKRIYADTRVKELEIFREKYKDVCAEEGITLPIVTIDEISSENDI